MIFNYNKNKCSVILFSIIMLIAFLGCTTVSENPQTAIKKASNPYPMYYGQGSGASSIEAINSARREAVKSAAKALLTPASVLGQEDELNALMDSINDFTPFVRKDSQVNVESSNEGGFYYHIGVRVNLSSLAEKLKSSDILGGQIDGKEGNAYSLPDQPAPAGKSDTSIEQKGYYKTDSPSANADDKETVVKAAAEAVPEASKEELAIISEYLDSLTYMVYFNEETSEDPFLSRVAVTSANRYLDNEGYEYIDLSQIEKIKEDQMMVYEEETGEAVSIIQWIAHKLNADIYIEVSLNTNSRSDGRKHYGSANVTLNCFNASTAEGRGSASYQTNPPAFSSVSEQDALSNAVSSAVFKGMAAAVSQAENETAKAVAKGFKYSLNIINTSDSRMMRDFEKKLGRRVKDVKRISYSPEESVFEVYLIGDISVLEDLVYDTAESIPGMEGVLLVMQRRNSITFDTGM